MNFNDKRNNIIDNWFWNRLVSNQKCLFGHEAFNMLLRNVVLKLSLTCSWSSWKVKLRNITNLNMLKKNAPDLKY